ncbi:MAG: aminotransferase class I/II-fold pyridoxal phosphate-dependent enzyme, partial [Candidatus Aenigmatarchaeota archaeon]
MELSKIAISLKPSATLRLNELAGKLKSEGRDIIHLGGGEPEFDLPDLAVKKSIEKLNSKRVKYTPTSGIKTLKKQISYYFKEIYDFSPDPENIVVSTGAKQC